MRRLQERATRGSRGRLHWLWPLLAVWASSLLLGASIAQADGTFCWDEVPGVSLYQLYAAAVPLVPYYPYGPQEPPYGVQAAPPSWSACDVRTYSLDNCAAGTCCVFVVDLPADLVFYFVTHDRAETNGGHAPVEPCP